MSFRNKQDLLQMNGYTCNLSFSSLLLAVCLFILSTPLYMFYHAEIHYSNVDDIFKTVEISRFKKV